MRSILLVVGVVGVVVATMAAWLWTSDDGFDEQRGSQIRSPEVSIGEAESYRWTVLGNKTGPIRPDFPRSLIAVDSQLCFGFERLDFGLPARPSLARCVEREALRGLAEGSIASVFIVKTGLDTWHVLAFGSAVDAFRIVGDSGTEVAADRIFIGDEIIALRLPNDIQIESMSWTVGRARYHCEPAPEAADSGRFCS